jgi:hypothetical protein
MKKISKPEVDIRPYGFYAKMRNPHDILLYRRISSELSWPNNAATMHILLQAYAEQNGVIT